MNSRCNYPAELRIQGELVGADFNLRAHHDQISDSPSQHQRASYHVRPIQTDLAVIGRLALVCRPPSPASWGLHAALRPPPNGQPLPLREHTSSNTAAVGKSPGVSPARKSSGIASASNTWTR